MVRNKLLAGCFIALFIISLVGCAEKEESKRVDLTKVREIKDKSGENPGIRIGLIPEEDIRKMASRYEPLAEYLARKLDRKVTLIYLDSYADVCDKFIYKQLDAAFFGSFAYALTHAKAGVMPIARPDYDGTSTYRGIIVVKAASGIMNVADMKGKRLALVHQATYAGYLYPLYYFNQHGISKLEEYFSKVVFAGSHDKAIFSVLRGEADIAISKDLVYQRIIKENPDLENKLPILSASGPVPSNAFCVSKYFDAVLRDKLKNTLLNLNNDDEAKPVLASLGATRFVETKDEDYNNLYDIIKFLDIDLNTYPYYKRPDIGFERAGYEHDSR